MKSLCARCIVGTVLVTSMADADRVAAANLLVNGNLDKVVPVEIVPGFFNPKPATWINDGIRALTGPYEDEMSSEPWAGPAPTPVTTDGLTNAPPYNANPDYGVFFHPFTGNTTPNGPATGHLYQDLRGQPSQKYTLTGWAGGEANALMTSAVFAIEFRNLANVNIQTVELNLLPTLLVPNGHPFAYKKYTLEAISPPGTITVRVRISMIGAKANPAGGGQAFVVDDFTLESAPVCPADLTGNGTIDGADLGILLSNWGSSGVGDLDGSGTVDGADLGVLLSDWGACS